MDHALPLDYKKNVEPKIKKECIHMQNSSQAKLTGKYPDKVTSDFEKFRIIFQKSPEFERA